jgi:hypothetical protein
VQSSTAPSRYYYVRFQYESTILFCRRILSIIVAGEEVAWIEVQIEAKNVSTNTL